MSSLLRVTDYLQTDMGNADAFRDAFRGAVCFDHRRKQWRVYRGHCWRLDTHGEVLRLAMRHVRQRQAAAQQLTDDAVRHAWIKYLLRCESSRSLTAMLSLAANLDGLADPGDAWDLDPWLLGVPNGVVDLRTGDLRDGKPADRITLQTGVPYEPAAACPAWDAFVSSTFAPKAGALSVADSEEVIAYLHRFLGYALTGSTAEQVFAMWTGGGSNGKTTGQETVSHVLGDYAQSTAFTTFETQVKGAMGADLAALVGRRFVVASEVHEGRSLNEARLKGLASGDPVTCRHLYGDYFTYRPVMKLVLSVNNMPRVGDQSTGFWRRVRVFPFVHEFPVQPGFLDRLLAEGPGILRWLVEGCLLWQELGLHTPAVITRATQDWRSATDLLAEFIADVLESAPDHDIPAGVLYDVYTRWADQQRLGPRERLSATAFGRKMKTRFERIDGARRLYRGIRLKDGCELAPHFQDLSQSLLVREVSEEGSQPSTLAPGRPS